jgi:sphingomyelin phosphodiesterase
MPENIENYAYNITEANMTPNRRPRWFMLYDIKNSYNIQDLSAKSMNDLVYSMVQDQPGLLDLYNAYYSKLSDVRVFQCNDKCKIQNLCKTVVTVLWERQRCDELSEMFAQHIHNFKQ